MIKYTTFSALCNFTEKQYEALEATKKYRYVLYGGSMGSGKSYFLRWAMVYWLMVLSNKYKKVGMRAGLFCEDYNSLNDRHISKLKFEFPKELGTYNEQRHEFHLHYRFGGGTICFRNLDDPSKYVSSEFAVIAIDEITRDPYSMFSILRTRLRWTGISETKFICASNPGGEPWVKRYWIDRNFPPEEKETDQFFYVKALPKDNPYLTESYYQMLESLDEKEKKAFLEGDWNAYESEMDAEGWMKLLTDTQHQDAMVTDRVHYGDGVLGVDPAAGGDRSAIVYKSEILKEVVFSQKLNDILQMVSPIVKAMGDFGNVKQIVVDRSGVGEGLYQKLRELNLPVKGIFFQSSSNYPEQFENMRAELYWKEREWILHGGKLLRNNGWNDWLNIKWMNYHGKYKRIQGKEELRRHGFKSPDVVDAAVLTNAASKNLRFDEQYKSMVFKDRMKSVWDNK